MDSRLWKGILRVNATRRSWALETSSEQYIGAHIM